MNPVPGFVVGTPFGARSTLWSCNRNSAGQGIHTGVDFPAPVGTPVVAARPGVARYVSHGSAFGYHQLAVENADGTEDFYAHMTGRMVGDGAQVKAGQRVGSVGAEGNVTGPHLHFEKHSGHNQSWNCAIIRDPMPSVLWTPPPPPDPDNEEFTVGYRDWDDKDKKALAKDVADAVTAQVLSAPMNAFPGEKGEDVFDGQTMRTALKRIYRKVIGS